MIDVRFFQNMLVDGPLQRLKKASGRRNSDSDRFLGTKLQATTANLLPT